MRIATIHQPNYLPWIGFFYKIAHSDCFIILDTVEYSKNSVINRNKIRVKDGWAYLTIPIEKKFHNSRIVNVELQKGNSWQISHFQTIEANYKKADYFHCYEDFFKELYNAKYHYLWEVNEKIIRYLLDCFDMNVEIKKSSELDMDPDLKKTDLLVSIIKEVEADIYLSGSGGEKYLDTDVFNANNIELKYTNFTHPVYKQRYQGFMPNMAAIDLLFNLGDKSKSLIKTNRA
jgi:hypothetical protein